MKRILQALLVVAAGAAGQAGAALVQYSVSYAGNGTPTTCDAMSANYCEDRYAAGKVVRATALSNTLNSGGSSSALVELANLKAWSGGLGIQNKDAGNCSSSATLDCGEYDQPEHAIDSNGRQDMMMFSFDEAVALTQVNLGWWGSDWDISVLRYTGAGANPSSDPTGKSWADLLNSGWVVHTVRGNSTATLANNNYEYRNLNNANSQSTHWIIGAYNPQLGATNGLDAGNDYFKLSKVIFSAPTNVPEPWTLALFGLGAGLLMRRRKA